MTGSEKPMLPTEVTLAPVVEADFAVLRELAGTIWHQHYVGIISLAQVDYMLAGRFGDEHLRQQIESPDKWLELLRVSGTPVGYCSYELADASAAGNAAAMKLGQLYVRDSHRGLGLGKLMLRHVERRGRDLRRSELFLQVNRRNKTAIDFYRAAGFKVLREAVFDIGRGFVMDDYVMGKSL